MKRTYTKFSVITIIAFCFVANSYSQAVQYFGDVKVKASVVYDPGFSTDSVKLVPVKKQLQWIQIDTDYKTQAKINPTTKNTAWLENVIMKYDVLLPRIPGKPQVVLSGKVEYWGIPMDGEVHHAQAFIHPQILKRYVPDLKMNKGSMKDLRLMITFEMNESPVGYGVLKPRTTTKPQEINSEIKKALALPSTRKVKDAIYNRNETPWGIINLSYYELIKIKN